MSSGKPAASFKDLPDELLARILSGICPAGFACSSSELRERVRGLSTRFSLKLTVTHEYLPILQSSYFKNSFTDLQLSEEYTVSASGTLYHVDLQTAIEYLMQFLLVQQAAQRALVHPLVTQEVVKVSWRAAPVCSDKIGTVN